MDCPIKVAEWIIRWCSPEAANIPSLGQEEAGQLAKLRLVLHPGELYELQQGDWDRIEDLSAGLLSEIQEQMDASKSSEPSAVLFGLRVPGLDASKSKRLIREFQSIDKLREAKQETVLNIDGIDESLAAEIRRWFRDSVNKQMLAMLEQNGFSFAG